jgi:hypothetical protein
MSPTLSGDLKLLLEKLSSCVTENCVVGITRRKISKK